MVDVITRGHVSLGPSSNKSQFPMVFCAFAAPEIKSNVRVKRLVDIFMVHVLYAEAFSRENICV